MREEQQNTAASQQSLANSGLVLAILGTALFGMKSIFIKLAYAQGVDTITLLTLRMLIALPFYLLMLFWLLRKTETVKPAPRQLLPIALLGFFGYYLSSLLDMEGLNHISAQLERLTLYTYPVITTLLGWFFLGEVITRRIIMALMLTYGGILLLYGYETSSGGGGNTQWGVMLVMMAATTFSCYVVFSKQYISALGSRMFTSIAMLISTVFVLVHFLVTKNISDLLINDAAWFYAFLLAIFSTLLPSFIVSEAIARLGAGKTSIVGTIGPVFTIIMAVLILGEPFGWFHLGGMLLVIAGVALLKK
ncbi:MAG: DMT family transporter [Thiolinea sp.]